MTTINRTSQQVENLAFIAGLTKYAEKVPSFTVGAVTIKATDAIASLQADNAAINAVTPAKAAWTVVVQAARNQRAETRALTAKVKQSLLVTYAGQTDILADFGLTPRKERTPLTTEQKVTVAAKIKATRAARNTMGSKQKAAVTGNVIGVQVTPVIATPVAAATGSPPPTVSPALAASKPTSA